MEIKKIKDNTTLTIELAGWIRCLLRSWKRS